MNFLSALQALLVYAASLRADPRRERYMDSATGLRRLKPTIDACNYGEVALSAKKLPEGEGQFAAALRHGPQDYAANALMACSTGTTACCPAIRASPPSRG